jgi:hypothetical protein
MQLPAGLHFYRRNEKHKRRKRFQNSAVGERPSWLGGKRQKRGKDSDESATDTEGEASDDITRDDTTSDDSDWMYSSSSSDDDDDNVVEEEADDDGDNF